MLGVPPTRTVSPTSLATRPIASSRRRVPARATTWMRTSVAIIVGAARRMNVAFAGTTVASTSSNAAAASEITPHR